MTSFAKRRVVGVFAFGLFMLPARARAATPEDAALAEELFRDGKRLAAEGSYAAACPKLAESHRLDPAGGTLLALGLCHEAEGKTASAWSDFTEAARVARQDRRADREQIAREHADAVFSRLSRLRIHVTANNAPDLEIRRDGVVLGRPAWDVAAPLDPGEHIVEAFAAGARRYYQVVRVTGDSASVDVSVPSLPATAPGAVIPQAPENSRPPGSAARWTAIGLGALGVVALGTSAYLFFDAKRLRDDANERCPDIRCADPTAVRWSHDAGVRADLATGVFASAVALAVAATTLLLVVHANHPPHVLSAFPRAISF